VSRFTSEWKDDELKGEIAGRVAANMDVACRFVVDRSQALAPVRTGLLRDNIIHEVHARGDVVEGRVGARAAGKQPRP
jgi:hypothetical protein